MPISVLLPTPLPPKMPTRWPRPQVRKASTARMPQPIGSRIESAFERQRSGAVEGAVLAGAVRAQRIERLAAAVEHPPQHFLAHPQRGVLSPGDDAVAVPHSARPIKRHGQHGRAAKADNLSGQHPSVRIVNVADLAH